MILSTTSARYARGLFLAAITVLGLTSVGTQAEAKTPGKTYCFRGVCHRVLTLQETSARIGKPTVLQASHYDSCKSDRFNPCGLTSSGEAFHAGRPDNAASPVLPNGTIVLVRYPATGKSAVLRINNAGPYHGKRMLDVSRGTAEPLGFKQKGVTALEVSIIEAPTIAEAKYRRNRSYATVPGYIGAFASVEKAGVRYAELKGKTAGSTAVAALYPQGREGEAKRRPSITGNGIERTWLAQGLTFEPTVSEMGAKKFTAAKLSRKTGMVTANR